MPGPESENPVTKKNVFCSCFGYGFACFSFDFVEYYLLYSIKSKPRTSIRKTQPNENEMDEWYYIGVFQGKRGVYFNKKREKSNLKNLRSNLMTQAKVSSSVFLVFFFLESFER